MKSNHILIKPIITEKAMQHVKSNVYSFQVNRNANKHQIKKIIESLFKVSVSRVRTIVRRGKTRRGGKKRIEKRLPDRKIAHILVSKGTIDLFPKT